LQLPRLREWRERRGQTQQELADDVGVARDSISKWETGHRGAYPRTARKLAASLDIAVEDLTTYPKSQAPQLEWVLSVSDADMLRLRLRDVPTEELRIWIKALAGNQRHRTIEDLRTHTDMREAVAKSLVMLRATIIRGELLSREDEDPKNYLPDLKRHLDALDIDSQT
jgi:transcriptional regulator with XRE-family HTH domain